MKKRFVTASILIMTALPLLILSVKFVICRRILEVLLMFIAVGAEIELLNMYDKSKKIPLWVKIVTVFLTIVMYFSVVNWFYMSSFGSKFREDPMIHKILKGILFDKFTTPFTAIILMFLAFMTMMVLVPDFEVSDVGRLFLSVLYSGICVGAFTVLYSFGLRFIVYLLAITVFTDTFALVFGMLFGKHKMAPTISPKKTWEGAIGGTATALVLGTVIISMYSLISPVFHGESIEFFDEIIKEDFSTFGNIVVAVVLSLFLSICSQIGDLVASKLKRAYGIKDYSNIFPGHGGILDRFDSAFFASAMFLLILVIILCLFA